MSSGLHTLEALHGEWAAEDTTVGMERRASRVDDSMSGLAFSCGQGLRSDRKDMNNVGSDNNIKRLTMRLS